MESKDKETTYLLTTRQAAAYMGVGENVIRELLARKHNPLPYINIPRLAFPRFTREMLIKYFNSFSTENGDFQRKAETVKGTEHD